MVLYKQKIQAYIYFQVALLTHSDPEELLPEEQLRKLLYPRLGREAGHYSPDWISRFLVQVRDIYLFIYLSVYLSFYLSICLSFYPSIYPRILK